jgi:hypothetical protein
MLTVDAPGLIAAEQRGRCLPSHHQNEYCSQPTLAPLCLAAFACLSKAFH